MLAWLSMVTEGEQGEPGGQEEAARQQRSQRGRQQWRRWSPSGGAAPASRGLRSAVGGTRKDYFRQTECKENWILQPRRLLLGPL